MPSSDASARHLDEVVAREMNQVSKMMRELDAELCHPVGVASIAASSVAVQRVEIALTNLRKRLHVEGMKRL